jgi:hypothetical protein
LPELLQSLYGLFLTVCDPNDCFFVDETFTRLALGGSGYRFPFLPGGLFVCF